MVGVLLSARAVFASFFAYPERWDLAADPDYVGGTLAVYGAGVILCSLAAGKAILAGLGSEPDGEPDETGFIWGDPPEG